MSHKIRQVVRKTQAVLLLITVFAAGFAFGNLDNISQAQSGQFALGDVDEAFQPFWEAYTLIQTSFVDADELSVPILVNGAINGMVDTLDDQHSIYYAPDDYDEDAFSGGMEGIGVVITTNEETSEIEVVNVYDTAPAGEVGVQIGDIFYSVDGERVAGWTQSELASKVRGPAGSTVNIVFKRDEELVEFNITRAAFEIEYVEAEVKDNDVAYIKLTQFTERAYSQVRDALEDIDVNERSGLIFDLRGNPGGLLRSAVDIGSMFIKDGVLVYEAFGDGSEEVLNVTGNYADIQVPIVVLIDENSASASELVAGAMKDYGIATLVGETTYGKGTVQRIRSLSNGGALRLTEARYLLPSREWIHEVGVDPDIEIEFDTAADNADQLGDPQLDAALNYLSGVILR
jgi:carboxyl-terminal processing protease